MSDAFAMQLQKLLAPFAGKPVIAHSDLFAAAKFVEQTAERKVLLQRHTHLLDSLQAELLIPAFNYQFPKTRTIDLRSAPVELGPLNQFMLRHWATGRTYDPIFSFATRTLPETTPAQNPFIAFGSATAFARTVEMRGAVLFYGAKLASLTMIHHLEHRAGGPLYRYDKDFAGTVTGMDGSTNQLIYRYHVRPMNRHLDYDWKKIEACLQSAQIWQSVNHGSVPIAVLISAKDLVDVILAELKVDPLFLLDAESRAWVEPLVQKLGRRLTLTDFES